MTSTRLEAELTDFVRNLLRREGVEADVGSDTALFERGYLNSLRILDLIAFLEKTLGRKIPDRDVKLVNFRSIRAIVDRVALADNGRPNADNSERLFTHRSARALPGSPIDALRDQGAVTAFERGTVALSGVALRVLEHFDRIALGLSQALGAAEQYYPILIALESLERAGYVGSFPQHLVRASAEAPGDDAAYAMAPAVCFHCYPQWQGRTVPATGVLLTARGRCCRYERDHVAPLERLRDFTMRELVVLGTHEQVENVRRALIERAQELVTGLDLDGFIVAATDPFYGPAADAKRLWQQAGALKYELRLTLERDRRSSAVTSFNNHQDHFGRAFNIRLTSGEPAHSGCVAFGLERWALAFLSQYGLDERSWPSRLTHGGNIRP